MSRITERYLNNAYLLKLRLLYGRRLLEGEKNAFRFEETCLVVRKIVESISFLCLISSEVNFGQVPRQVSGQWNAREILHFLRKKNLLRFPQQIRVNLQGHLAPGDTRNCWHIDTSPTNDEDVERVLAIYEQTHGFLHELNPYETMPFGLPDFPLLLAQNFEHLARDHQWLWNRIWQHGIVLGHEPFLCNLRAARTDVPPQLIAHERYALDEHPQEPWRVDMICAPIAYDDEGPQDSSRSIPDQT